MSSPKISVICKEWECKLIGEIIEDISMGPFGSDIKVSNFVSTGVPVLNGSNVNNVKVYDKFKNYVTKEKARELKKAVAHKGDIIVTHRGTLGQISYIPFDSKYDEYVISQSQFRVKFMASVNPEYVVRFFLSDLGQKVLLEGKGHTGVPAIAQPTTTFRKYTIPIPRREEQDKIVNLLSDVDTLIISLEKIIEKKKAIKQGAMQELLTGKKRLTGFEGNVKYEKLKLMCDTFGDGDWIESKDQSKEGVRLIQTGNIGVGRFINKADKKRYISEETFYRLNCTEIKPNDILVSRLPEPAGRACIIPNMPSKMITSVDCTIIRFTNDYNPNLFIQYSQSKLYQDQINLSLGGSTRQRISRNELGNILIPVFPTKEEQNAIASILNSFEHEIFGLESKLSKYRQIKQGMMQELLTGRIRLR